jgi:hypothetical protein
MLTGVAAFLFLFVAILAIPITFSYQVAWAQTLQSEISVHWLFGLVRIRLPSYQSKTPTQEGKKASKATPQVKRSARQKQQLFSTLKQKAFRRRIMRFFSDCWRAIHKQDLRLRMRIGLGDPADTGHLWAIVGPMAGILGNLRDMSVQIEPEFIDATFELDSSGNIRLVPIQMIYLVLGLLLSPPVWQALRRSRSTA